MSQNLVVAGSVGRVQASNEASASNTQMNTATIAASRRRFVASLADDYNMDSAAVSSTASAVSDYDEYVHDLNIGITRRNNNNFGGSFQTRSGTLMNAESKLINPRGDWTTNLHREFKPNSVTRSVNSFESCLASQPTVEARLHALRSVFHCACDGLKHRQVLRSRIPKLVGAVAAIASEADATLNGGNKVIDMAFRIMTVMLKDDEAFDTNVVLNDVLMSQVAPRALFAGREAGFSCATFIRRISEISHIAHAVVHNDVLIESILRVLEEESLLWSSNNTNANAASSGSSNQSSSRNSPQFTSPSGGIVLSTETAATVVQLRIALLNITSRQSAATFLLSRSQRFINLLARDSEMSVSSSKILMSRTHLAPAALVYANNTHSSPATKNQGAGAAGRSVTGVSTSQAGGGGSTSYSPSAMFANNNSPNSPGNQNSPLPIFARPVSIGGALLEERENIDLYTGKRLLFDAVHVATLALTGTIFDANACASAENLSSMPAHPSIPSEAGSGTALRYSTAGRYQTQPLQLRLEAYGKIKGEELAVLASVSAVCAMRTLHSMCVREGGGQNELLNAVRPRIVKALSVFVSAGNNPDSNNENNSPSQRNKSDNAASPVSPNRVVAAKACVHLLDNMKNASAAALDILEEADNDNIMRKLENYSSEGKALLDKLRTNLYASSANNATTSANDEAW